MVSKALPGEHYCLEHQGNHSHYAPHNCTVCQLQEKLDRANSIIGVMEAELTEKSELLKESADLLGAEDWSQIPKEIETQNGMLVSQANIIIGLRDELTLARKLFRLAAEDHIFFSTYNEAKQTWDEESYPCINCNDVFVPGADAEPLPEEDIDAYAEVATRWPLAGSSAWCAWKRNAKPWRHISTGAWKKEYDEALAYLEGK